MTRDRQLAINLIDEAVTAGARCIKACAVLEIDVRTLQRWKKALADATHPLTKTDIKCATDAINNDPFFSAHPQWLAAIKQLLEMGVRAEQQALAKWGLNYVIDGYLPRKLEDRDGFLP